MKQMWVLAILPAMVASLLVACGGSHGGGDHAPTNRSRSSTQDEAPQVSAKVDSTTANTTDTAAAPAGDANSAAPATAGQTAATQAQPPVEDDGSLSGQANEDETATDASKTATSSAGIKIAAPVSDTTNVGGPGPLNPGADQAVTPAPSGGEKYSGTADDFLRGIFTEQMKTKTGSVGSDDAKLAKLILDVHMHIDDSSNTTVIVTFKPKKDGGATQTVVFTGVMDHVSGVATLTASDTSLTASLTCLDKSYDTCFVSALRLERDNAADPNADPTVSYTLIRHTEADIAYRDLRDGRSNIYHRFSSLLNDSVVHLGTPNTLRATQMQSFEVIGGMSKMEIALISRENELITGSVDLRYDPTNPNGALSEAMDIRNMNLQDWVDLEKGTGFRDRMQSAITGMTLTRNDGLGHISVAVQLNADQKGPASEIDFDMNRFKTSIVNQTELANLINHGSRQ